MSRVRDLLTSLTAVVEAVEDDRLDAVLAHGPVDDVEAAITRARDLLVSAIGPSAAPRPAVEYRLLGPVEVAVDGRPLDLGSTKQRRLLLRLLVADGQRVTLDTLIDAVWGDAPPAKPRVSVQAYVSRLRRVLDGCGTIKGMDCGYAVDLAGSATDLRRAERLLAGARQGRHVDPEWTARACGRALAQWRGRPADELGDHLAAMAVRARAADVRRQLARHQALALLDLGETDRAVTELTAAVQRHLYDDHLHGLLLRALARQGRHGVAVASYERFRRRLAEDFGADPSPELQSLLPQLMGAAA